MRKERFLIHREFLRAPYKIRGIGRRMVTTQRKWTINTMSASRFIDMTRHPSLLTTNRSERASLVPAGSKLLRRGSYHAARGHHERDQNPSLQSHRPARFS